MAKFYPLKEMSLFYSDELSTEKTTLQDSSKVLEEEKKAMADIQLTTLWSFPERGNWATHKGDYRGNFAPQIPRNLIVRYSNKGDVVLDQMVGSGTTLIEAKILGRNSIGVDINKEALEITKERLTGINKNYGTNSWSKLFLGDARNLEQIDNNSIDLICTHPPYLNIIRYSEDNVSDLSSIGSVKVFINEIRKIARESYRVLKEGKIASILIGDTRKRKHYVPLSAYLLKVFLDEGFLLMEDIIKYQWNCSSTPKWKKISLKYNFHMIMHEHLFVFRKPTKNENLTIYKYSSKNNEIL